MLIVSWNLARNTLSKAKHERAWHYLAALDPDIALLQEAVIPTWATDRWHVVLPPVRKWGSAVLAKPDLALEPFAGQCAIAAIVRDRPKSGRQSRRE